MWLGISVFPCTLDLNTQQQYVGTESTNLTLEEVDIAHYIGGFVIKKLKDRKTKSEVEVLVRLVDSKCNTVIDKFRAKSKTVSKDRALRSNLANRRVS